MFTSSNTGVRASKQRYKRRTPIRSEMTAMVGVAFILLAFLLTIRSYGQPNVMELAMPVAHPDDSQSTGSCRLRSVIFVLIGQKHRLFYYSGLLAPADDTVQEPELFETDFSANGLRQVLLSSAETRNSPVFIKPLPGAKYRDLVDVIDEINIANHRSFALTKATPEDICFVQTNAK